MLLLSSGIVLSHVCNVLACLGHSKLTMLLQHIQHSLFRCDNLEVDKAQLQAAWFVKEVPERQQQSQQQHMLGDHVKVTAGNLGEAKTSSGSKPTQQLRI